MDAKLRIARKCHSAMTDLYEKMVNAGTEKVAEEFNQLFQKYNEIIKTCEASMLFADGVTLNNIHQEMLDFLQNLESSQDINLIISSTYKAKFFAIQKSILKQMLSAIQDWKTIDDEIIKQQSEDLFQDFKSRIKQIPLEAKHIPGFLKELSNIRNLMKDIRNIDIYVHVMKQIYNYFIEKQVRAMTFSLDMIIDEDKKLVLDTLYRPPNSIDRKNCPLLSTFGLIAVTSVMSWEDIFKVLDWKSTTFSKDQFLEMAKKNRVGVIFINSKLKNPIRYNTDRFLRSRPPKPNLGVCEEMAIIFQTIEYIPQENAKFEISIETHFMESSSFVVLQFLSSDYAKFLGSFRTFSKPNVFLRQPAIEPILRYHKKIPPRIEGLTQISLMSSVDKWFLQKKPDPEYNHGAKIDPKYLRNTIYMNLMSTFDSLKKGTRTQKEIMTDPIYVDVFADIITQEYFQYTHKEFYVSERHLPLEELYTTFLFNLKVYQRLFVKELYDAVKELKISNQKSRDLFSDVIQKILLKFISNESNLYMFLQTKTWILKMKA